MARFERHGSSRRCIAGTDMTFGSLFAGIGGFDLGFERAGMKCIWQVEIDPFCQKVLAKHWPDVKRYGDITEVDWSRVERPDVICGGFPCQPVSVAGKRLGADDERWLWPEVVRCLSDLRPRFAVLENVPGLLTAGMGSVLGDLWESGYDAEWQVVPASAFGAPHRRDRVFLVTYPSGERWACINDGLGQEAKQEGSSEGNKRFWGHHTPVHIHSLGRAYVSVAFDSRVDDGVPEWVDRRLKGCGNAIVPQITEWIGRQLVNATR